MKPKTVAVIGDGGWGTTLAIVLSRAGHRVRLWSPFPEYAGQLSRTRDNVKFLPGIPIPQSIQITGDLEQAVGDAELIALVVPSPFMREVCEKLKRVRFRAPLVSASKGIERQTLLRMTEVIHQVLGRVRVAVLSGPTIAVEVAQGLPAACVAASKDRALAREVQDAFTTETFRVYAGHDLVGAELGGALKNVIAIAAGLSDGLGFGTNAKSALITRGLAEMTRLGVRLGARAQTFAGLSGMGDLITTCISERGRNRWVGEQLSQGKTVEEIQKQTPMVAEGIYTTQGAYGLSKKLKVEMPITNRLYHVLFERQDPRAAAKDLMARALQEE